MSQAIALLTIALVLVVWVAVQNAWRRSFPEACPDPDVLAGRGDCLGCDLWEACALRLTDQAAPAEEEA